MLILINAIKRAQDIHTNPVAKKMHSAGSPASINSPLLPKRACFGRGSNASIVRIPAARGNSLVDILIREVVGLRKSETEFVK